MGLAILFPGQGSQVVGMGCSLFNGSSVAREIFQEIDDCLEINLSKIMFEGPNDELNLTVNTQPALMAVSLALVNILKKEANIDLTKISKFFAGHSLGELSAHAAAETFNLRNAILITRKRGYFMQKAVPFGEGSMAAVLGLDYNKISNIIDYVSKKSFLCSLANDNCPGQIVVSGHKKAVEKVIDISIQKGAKKTIYLPVSAPFHCDLMLSAAMSLEKYLNNITFSKPLVPIVTNVNAKEELDPDILKKLLITQITHKVRWRESIEEMISKGVTTFVEIGTGKILSKFVRRINPDSKVISINTMKSIEKFISNI